MFNYLYTSSICILVLLLLVTILMSAAFRCMAIIRGEVLIRERHLFLCGYPKIRHFFENRRLLEECGIVFSKRLCRQICPCIFFPCISYHQLPFFPCNFMIKPTFLIYLFLSNSYFFIKTSILDLALNNR